MRVTSVLIKIAHPGQHPERLKAFVNLTIEGGAFAIRVNGCRLVRCGSGRLVLCWPSRKVPGASQHANTMTYHRGHDGRPYYHRDDVHPLNEETRRVIDAIVLRAYYNALRACAMDYAEEIPETEPAAIPIDVARRAS